MDLKKCQFLVLSDAVFIYVSNKHTRIVNILLILLQRPLVYNTRLLPSRAENSGSKLQCLHKYVCKNVHTHTYKHKVGIPTKPILVFNSLAVRESLAPFLTTILRTNTTFRNLTRGLIFQLRALCVWNGSRLLFFSGCGDFCAVSVEWVFVVPRGDMPLKQVVFGMYIRSRIHIVPIPAPLQYNSAQTHHLLRNTMSKRTWQSSTVSRRAFNVDAAASALTVKRWHNML